MVDVVFEFHFTCFACMYVCEQYVCLVLQKAEESIKSAGTGVIDSLRAAMWFLGRNPGPWSTVGALNC